MVETTKTGEIPTSLPLYASVPLGLLLKDAEKFEIRVGLDEALVAQLKQYSLDESDEDIQKNTSDRKRFGEGSYEEWYSKNRTPFALVKDGSLAALVWFGPKPLGRKSLKYLSEEEQKKELEQHEEVWHTLVYRSYKPYRGAGLMSAFVRFALDAYRELYPDAKFWVGLSDDNKASAGLATRIGFIRRDDLFDAEKNWVAMTIE